MCQKSLLNLYPLVSEYNELSLFALTILITNFGLLLNIEKVSYYTPKVDYDVTW